MTFAQAQWMFRTHKSYETAWTYLVVATQRKAEAATDKGTLFNATGEVASWLSAPEKRLLTFRAAKRRSGLCRASERDGEDG